MKKIVLVFFLLLFCLLFFVGCEYQNELELIDIVIENDVKYIKENAFYDRKDIANITISNSVKSIDTGAFWGCTNLSSITIPESVTVIGDYAFYGCESLKNIIIPEGVTIIGEKAFSGCKNLESVIISKSVLSIGFTAFGNCQNIQSISVDEGNKTYKSIDGDLYSKDGKVLIQYAIGKSQTSFSIPSDVVNIEPYAVSGCKNLVSITVDDSVEKIDYQAFSSCINLENLIIPDNIIYIGHGAFDGCNNLIYNIYDNAYYLGNPNNPYTVLVKITDSSSTSCNISNSVKVISYYAFEGCSNLKSITLPDGINSIGLKAFENCLGLAEITIPDSVVRIDFGAFEGCNNIRKMTIPFIGNQKNTYTKTHFGYIFGAESYDDNDKKVPVALNTVVITDEKNINAYAFDDCKNIVSLSLPSSIAKIDASAFAGCSKLVEVYNLSDLDIKCGDEYENGGVGANALVIHTDASAPSRIYEKEDFLFYFDENLNKISLLGYNGSENKIVLPNYINSLDYEINKFAFYDRDDITEIIIGQGVTNVGVDAFSWCSNLKYIEYDNAFYLGNDSNPFFILVKAKNTTITSCKINDGTKIIYYDAFRNCDKLAQITIPEGVIHIGSYAFLGCSNLTNLIIPDSVTMIGSMAFGHCDSLVSFALSPNSKCEIIGDGAFYSCFALEEIMLANSVVSIEEAAFDCCFNLQYVFYTGTEEEWLRIKIAKRNNYINYANQVFNYILKE